MSKILSASCVAGVVTSQGVPVTEAVVLSEGVGSSSGALLLEEDKAFYITSNASDIKQTLNKVVAALNKIGETLTAIGAGMTGPSTAPPPTLATNVAEITQLAIQLTQLENGLK